MTTNPSAPTMPENEPARRSEINAAATMVSLLSSVGVDFVVVGPWAAIARGASPLLAASAVLDITPEPSSGNLSLVAEALRRAGTPRLRTDHDAGPTLTPHPDIFQYLEVLPVSTELADLTIVLHPLAGPALYPDLLGEASPVLIGGVQVLAPGIDGLLRGMAGGWQQPDPRILDSLRRIQRMEAAQAAAGSSSDRRVDDPYTDLGLHGVVLNAVNRLQQPASIRDILLATGGWRDATYTQVKAAAETLTTHGKLVRIKVGNAHRYRPNIDAETRTAHEIAALLSTSAHPESVTAEALRLLGKEPQ